MKCIVLTVLLLLCSSCIEKEPKTREPEQITISLLVPDAQGEVQEIVGVGPNGETPTSVSELYRMVADIKRNHFKEQTPQVALAMHDVNNDWSQMVIKGLEETLALYGVKLCAITDGELQIEKQIADYNHLAAMNLDILITLPLDAKACYKPLKEFARKDIKLLFIDAVPDNFTKDDFIGWAVGDSYVMGRSSAEVLRDSLNGSGKVALLNWKNRMFTVDRRTEGARDIFSQTDGITIAEELYFSDFYEIPGKIESLLEKHPDIAGLWTVWDYPALEVLKTLKRLGKELPVTTVDLGQEIARELASGGMLIGTGTDNPYELGVAEALLTVATLAQRETPEYIVVPAEKVTSQSLPRAWKRVYREELPKDFGAL